VFRSAAEAAQKSWFFYEPFTLLSTYKTFQKRFIKAYSPYENLVECYRTATRREVYPVTEAYLSEHNIAEENVALLKNAIELWRSASQTTDAIAPLLFHYSWHCFNAFFAYTFFRWNPQHGSSHGIEIPSETLNGDLTKLAIRFRKEEKKGGETRGLFQRLIDAWTLLGTSPAFSAFLPILKDNQFTVRPNQLFLLEKSKSLGLARLVNFDPVDDYERPYWKRFGRKELIQNMSFTNSMNLPTRILQSYLILFIASSVARYRPILWSSVLSGESKAEASLAFAYRSALLTYAQYGGGRASFLDQLSALMQKVIEGRFELRTLP
jgi:hypothetical protein